MKRFWLVLLSLGLIVAFSTSAMAVDVKFSGEYYAAGMYLDRTTLLKDPPVNRFNNVYDNGRTAIPVTKATPAGTYVLPAAYGNAAGLTMTHLWNAPTQNLPVEKQSTAFYFQRLRIGAQFIVSPGLSLITRADVMERSWGAARSAAGAAVRLAPSTLDTFSAGTAAENENIAFDLAYISWASPIGLFGVGYQIDQAWGTVFGDSSIPTGKLTYYLPLGQFGIILQTGKFNDGENSRSATNLGSLTSDTDNSFYTAAVRYASKSVEAGFLVRYNNMRSGRSAAATWIPSESIPVPTALKPFFAGLENNWFSAEMTVNSIQQAYVIAPYVKAKLGPVAIQAEVSYATGEQKADGDTSGNLMRAFYGDDKVKIKNWTMWVDALADMGMFYAGGTFAFVTGDDPNTKDTAEGGAITGGRDWNPCLILFNNDLTYWAGSQSSWDGTQNMGPMTNAYFFQVRGGVRPVEKLDMGLSVSYAHADKTPALGYGVGGANHYKDRDYGWEIDLTANYKLTNNLTYMLGGGYLMTGKYFKGINAAGDQTVADDFLVINKLTLTF